MRAQAAHSICKLFEKFSSNLAVYQSWIEIILPLVLDPEGSIQKFALESIQKLFLDRIKKSKYHKTFNRPFNSLITLRSLNDDIWAFFQFVTNDIEGFFIKAINQIGKSIDKGFVKNIQKLLETQAAPEETYPGAWMLLSIAAPFCVASINTDLVLRLWEYTKISGKDLSAIRRILKIFEVTADRIEKKDKKNIIEDLRNSFNDFSIPISLITPTLGALNKLVDKNFGYFEPIVSNCETILGNLFSSKETKQTDLKLISKSIFTTGEISSVNFFFFFPKF